MALLALEEKLLGASVEVLMADEVFYELATVANAQGSLELTDAAYEKAEKLRNELAEREEREELLLEQAEAAMEKAQHWKCDEVIDYIAEEIVNHKFAMEAAAEKYACVQSFITHRWNKSKKRLIKWAKKKFPKGYDDGWHDDGRQDQTNYFRNYHWLALAYAKKHKLEFWLQGKYGTGNTWGKNHVTLVDMKQMHDDIKASVE